MREIIITARGNSVPYGQELQQSKDLWRALFVRELKIRYKQTALGIAWVVIQPLLSTLIWTIVFGGLFSANTANNETPYALFALMGLVWWQLFVDGVNFGAISLTNLGALVTKTYFPRLVAPIASLSVAVINFGINFMLAMILLVIFYHQSSILVFLGWAPLLFLIALLPTAGLGFFFAAINLKYRDVKHALPFMLQALMFLTPVIYPTSTLPSWLQNWIYLNPLTLVINQTRHILFQTTMVSMAQVAMSLLSAVIIFIIGLTYFRKTERYFADVI
jgi:lipopolysaccharide transport system permease protein